MVRGKYSGIKYLTYLSLVRKGSLYKDLSAFGLWLSGSPLPKPQLYLTQSGLIHWNVPWSSWLPSRGYCEGVQNCPHSSCSRGRKGRCSTEAWIGPCCWEEGTGGRTGKVTRWCPSLRSEANRDTAAARRRCLYTCLRTWRSPQGTTVWVWEPRGASGWQRWRCRSPCSPRGSNLTACLVALGSPGAPPRETKWSVLRHPAAAL